MIAAIGRIRLWVATGATAGECGGKGSGGISPPHQWPSKTEREHKANKGHIRRARE